MDNTRRPSDGESTSTVSVQHAPRSTSEAQGPPSAGSLVTPFADAIAIILARLEAAEEGLRALRWEVGMLRDEYDDQILRDTPQKRHP